MKQNPVWNQLYLQSKQVISGVMTTMSDL